MSISMPMKDASTNCEKFQLHRPFPSSLVPLFQNESKCETILMKMTLICMKMKLHAELSFALDLVLKQRHKWTPKWPIVASGTENTERMALMRDDIRLAKITTKPRFENANFKFYQEIIPKAAKMKKTPTWKQLEGNASFKKCRANEAW